MKDLDNWHLMSLLTIFQSYHVVGFIVGGNWKNQAKNTDLHARLYPIYLTMGR